MATLKRDGTCCLCNQRMAAGTRIKWQRINGQFKPSHFEDCNQSTQAQPETTTMSDIETIQSMYPRGSTRVTSSPDGGNRGDIRKWIISKGATASTVVKLTLSQLADVYNDTTDGYLQLMISGAWPRPEQTIEQPAVAAAPVTAPSSDLQSTVMQLVTLLQQQQQTAAIDLDTVRRVMREEMPSLIPVTRIEVVNNGQVISLDPAPHHKQFAKLVKLLSSSQVMHAYLVGPAGSGKTTAAENAAKARGRKCYIQGATSGAHELLGWNDAEGNYHTTPFRQAFQFGGDCILDEIDGGANDSLLVINAGTANGFMTFPDNPEPVAMHPDFRVIACANTWGKGADRQYVGRSQLDASTIDRFFMIEWNYDEKLERALCGNEAWCDRVQALRAGAEKQKAQIVISPRAAIKGAALLAEGWLQSDVEEGLIWRGLDKELRRRIEGASY